MHKYDGVSTVHDKLESLIQLGDGIESWSHARSTRLSFRKKMVKVVKVVKVVIDKGKRMLFNRSIQKSGYWETALIVNYNASPISITTFWG